MEMAKSRRHKAKTFTDIDFADDIALLSNALEQAQQLLLQLQSAAIQIGLHINESKTEYIALNQNTKKDIKTQSGKALGSVDNFLYLGSWVMSCEQDINTRIAKAWAALNKLNKIWKSKLKTSLKMQFFRATVESVLLYGANTWTLTEKLKKKLDGSYTRMLRVVKNITRKDKIPNTILYENTPKITHTIQAHRVQFSGHCLRSSEELISSAILWEPRHGNRPRGRPRKTFLDQLEADTGLHRDLLPEEMKNREEWRKRTKFIGLRSTE